MSNKLTGDWGERDVVVKVLCPSCGKALALVRRGKPLVDVQCTNCDFAAQIKTSRTAPRSTILGAGWDIMEKVLKTGRLVPPLITNFVWSDTTGEHQLIRFYPLIPISHLAKRTLSDTAQRADYRMFTYTGLDQLPHFVLYPRA